MKKGRGRGGGDALHEIRLMMLMEKNNNKKKKPFAPPPPRMRIVPEPAEEEYEENEEEDVIPAQDKMYRDPNGPYTNARWARVLIYILFAWVFLLTLWIIFFSGGHSSASSPQQLANRDASAPSSFLRSVPFNLVPDAADTTGRIMTLKISIDYARLLRYDICCKKGPIFACRAVSKTIGLDGFVTSEGKAVMQIHHPDMVGAQCNFIWENRKD